MALHTLCVCRNTHRIVRVHKSSSVRLLRRNYLRRFVNIQVRKENLILTDMHASNVTLSGEKKRESHLIMSDKLSYASMFYI